MEKVKYLSRSVLQTRRLARALAEEVSKTKPGRRALVIGLTGELGTGKTTLIRAFIHALGVKRKVMSPTFLLWRRLPLPRRVKAGLPRGKNFKNVFHLDVYRLEEPKELYQFGLNEAVRNPENIIIVEWAERVRSVLPQGTIWLHLEHGQKENERYLTLSRR